MLPDHEGSWRPQGLQEPGRYTCPMKVLVTGGGQGIGAAIADVFAAGGADVMISSRNRQVLDARVTELRARHPQVQVLAHDADLAEQEGVRSLADLVGKRWGKLDVLVNNAGLFVPGKVTEEADGVLEAQLRSNLFSAYHLTRALLPQLQGEGRKHIFNMCSVASIMAYPNGGSYSISKWALLGFTKVLREELKAQGIRVTAVIPGATYTRSWEGSGLPEERFMKASDVASMIWSAYALSASAVVEEIIMRPQEGDI